VLLGYSLDLSYGVMARALAHLDSVYRFGRLGAEGWLCRTNIASNTAYLYLFLILLEI
jgi:xanthine dehydrogenase/oxidase